MTPLHGVRTLQPMNNATQTPQQKIKSRLEASGIPFKQVECYGSQIVVTAHCRNAAERWAALLGQFAKVRGVIESVDEAVEQKGTCLARTYVSVWRTYAAIK